MAEDTCRKKPNLTDPGTSEEQTNQVPYKEPAEDSKFYGLESHFNEDVVFYKDVRIFGELKANFSFLKNISITPKNLHVLGNSIFDGDSYFENINAGIVTARDGLNVGCGGTTLRAVVSTGNVGIGSTIPEQKLDIAGSAKIDVTIYDSVNAPGKNGYDLVRDQKGLRWIPQVAESNLSECAGSSIGVSTDGIFILSGGVPIYPEYVPLTTCEFGNIRLNGTIYDGSNQPGTTGQILAKNSLGSLTWINQGSISAGAGGAYRSVQFHNSTDTLGGATDFVYDEVNLRVGIGSTLPTTKLDILGNTKIVGILTVGSSSITIDGITDKIKVGSGVTIEGTGNATYSGIITATSFVGNVTGTATYASTAGIATYATSSGIATYATNAGISTTATKLQNARTFEITGDVVASPISFDGTGNVSLTATIQPNSVALGTDTTGDYVQTISGTSNQITVTGGTGESSTPTLSIPNQFTAPQDVTISRDLQVNRNLNVTGNITIGGTSATLFTTELKVSDPDLVLGVRTDGSGNDISTDNTANHGGIAIASTEGNPLVTIYNPGIGESTLPTYKKIMWFKSGSFSGLGTDAWLINYGVGIGSTQFPSGTRLAVGNVQFTENDLSVVRNINASGIITSNSLSIGSNQVISSSRQLQNIASLDATTTATIESAIQNSPNVFTDLQVTGVSTFTNGPVLIGSATSTGTASQRLQVTGGAYISNRLGIGVTNPSYPLEVAYSGTDSFISGIFIGGGIISRSSAALKLAAGSQGGSANGNSILLGNNDGIILDGGSGYTSGIELKGGGGNIKVTQGSFLVGTATSTGTTSQPLQVSGGAYVSGNLGIGITNPAQKLEVLGGEIKAGRVDSSFEGGQLSFGRAIDNATGWYIDVYGNTSTPNLRFVDVSNSEIRAVIDGSGNFLINSASATGTASQPLQVSGGAYVSGNLGVGVANPTSKLQVAGNSLLRSISIDGPNCNVGAYTRAQLNTALGISNNSGYSAFAWNYTNGNGELDLFINRGAGSTGGFRIYDAGNDSNNPTLLFDLTGTGNLSIGGGVSGGTATPSFINLGTTYSNGATRDKCKIYLYNSGTEQYGFSVGPSGDVQYHSNSTHDFYISNSKIATIHSGGLSVTNGLRTLEQVRATGWWNTPIGSSYSGLAVEMGVSSGAGYVLCYNRDTSTYGTLNIQGSSGNTLIQLPASGSTINVTGSLAVNSNGSTLYGPNTTWAEYLRVGGNGNADTTNASVVTTNGNLHLDSKTGGFVTYLNYYKGTGGVAFGNGASGAVAWMGPDGDLWKGGADNSGSLYWHAGNDGSGSGLDADLLDGINSPSFARVDSSSTFTVPTYFQSNLGSTSGSLTNPPLQAYATGSNSAFMSFHRSGSYAVNMGLDSDNILRIGGWSASANRWQLDMSGNMTTAGSINAPGGFVNNDNGIRIANPGGASYVTNNSSVSGAIKIRLPVAALGSNTMMSFRVSVYQYSTGLSQQFIISGYNYYNSPTYTWYNVSAVCLSDAGTRFTVRFGFDGTTQCVYIGELNSSWYYPQVFVTDFCGGYSGYTTQSTWASGWNISFETSAFAGVTATRTAGMDADTLDGLNSGYSGANTVLRTDGNSYLLLDNWLRLGSGTGIYMPSGAYIYEDTSYGWYMRSRISSSSSLKLQTSDGISRGWYYADTAYTQGFLNTSGGWSFKVDNSGNATATGTVTAQSDIRFKENVKTLENSLDKVLNLRGVEYNRNDDPTKRKQIGVIAQEVEEVIPELVFDNVTETPDGTKNEYKSVAYQNIIGLLIEAIKEQDKNINMLKGEIESIKQKLN